MVLSKYHIALTRTKTKTNPWTRLSASLHLCAKETSKVLQWQGNGKDIDKRDKHRDNDRDKDKDKPLNGTLCLSPSLCQGDFQTLPSQTGSLLATLWNCYRVLDFRICIIITLYLYLHLYLQTSNLANSVSLANISVRPEVSLFISSSHLNWLGVEFQGMDCQIMDQWIVKEWINGVSICG